MKARPSRRLPSELFEIETSLIGVSSGPKLKTHCPRGVLRSWPTLKSRHIGLFCAMAWPIWWTSTPRPMET